MRSLLNSFALPTIVLIVVGGTVVLALVGVLVARKLFPNLADGPYHDVVEGLRGVYHLVFALILAFVIASVLGNFATAESTVAAEAATLAHMRRANDALPAEQQVRLNTGLRHYVNAIGDTEWETMQRGEGSPRASAALETLYALYVSYSPLPTEGVEAEFYSEAVDQLLTVGSTRRERLSLSAGELPILLRIVLPLGVLILLVLEYRPKMALRAQLLHIGLLAMVVSFCYLLTIVMDYPFSGDVALGNEEFKRGALAAFWASEEGDVTHGNLLEDLSPGELAGVWNADTFGVVVIREVGDEVRAVYREQQGTIVGRVFPDGVFRGWWCQEPTRKPNDDAGDVEWRLVNESRGEVLVGLWRFGSAERFRGDWDLEKVGAPNLPTCLHASTIPPRSASIRNPSGAMLYARYTLDDLAEPDVTDGRGGRVSRRHGQCFSIELVLASAVCNPRSLTLRRARREEARPMRSLLNSFSSSTIVLMVVGGTAALAIVGVLVARKLFPNLADGPYDDVVDGLRVVYELVFALILAFVIGSVLESFSSAESTVAAEAGTLAHMTRANEGLPLEQQLRLARAWTNTSMPSSRRSGKPCGAERAALAPQPPSRRCTPSTSPTGRLQPTASNPSSTARRWISSISSCRLGAIASPIARRSFPSCYGSSSRSEWCSCSYWNIDRSCRCAPSSSTWACSPSLCRSATCSPS